MATLQTLCELVRRRFKLPAGYVSPRLLTSILVANNDIVLRPIPYVADDMDHRICTRGNVVQFCEADPRDQQEYYRARGCCAFISREMGQARHISPDQMLMLLCGPELMRGELARVYLGRSVIGMQPFIDAWGRYPRL